MDVDSGLTATDSFIISVATLDDCTDMHRIRTSVSENKLSDPSRVTLADYRELIEARGRGWVCRVGAHLRGFCFADLSNGNIWAVFVEPGFERRGIGRMLHDRAVSWLFENGVATPWLTTAPGTRAERFYTAAGWRQSSTEPNGDCRLELDLQSWNH
jgi:GNAT superfamily N-acetyltransferase